MKTLLEEAKKKFDIACQSREEVCSIRYYLGYIAAIKDVNRKLHLEGLEDLEDA